MGKIVDVTKKCEKNDLQKFVSQNEYGSLDLTYR